MSRPEHVNAARGAIVGAVFAIAMWAVLAIALLGLSGCGCPPGTPTDNEPVMMTDERGDYYVVQRLDVGCSFRVRKVKR